MTVFSVTFQFTFLVPLPVWGCHAVCWHGGPGSHRIHRWVVPAILQIHFPHSSPFWMGESFMLKVPRQAGRAELSQMLTCRKLNGAVRIIYFLLRWERALNLWFAAPVVKVWHELKPCPAFRQFQAQGSLSTSQFWGFNWRTNVAWSSRWHGEWLSWLSVQRCSFLT